MGFKASVNRLAKAVSTAVQNFAATNRLVPQDYAMIAMFDPDHERIDLVVGIIPPMNRVESTGGLMLNLADAFGFRISAFYHVVPIVRKIQN